MLVHLKELLMEPTSSQRQPRKLHAWIQHVITQASSRSIYGPLNPLDEEEVEEAFWTFEHDLGLLLLNFAPDFFKKKAIAAREKVAQSFLRYYQKKAKNTIAHLEVPFNFAILNNTIPSAFWMISHVFSRPALLASLREELLHTIEVKETGSNTLFTVNVASLKLNFRPNIRQVVEDTVLNDQYFLEKGAIIQMSTQSVHQNPAHWGSDAKDLNLHRFLHDEQRRPRAAAEFGTYGIAPHVRPGRHFATTEILALTAQLVMRYDVEPVGAVWEIPKQNTKGFSGVTGLCMTSRL
ncbi:hypothetical protein MMC30_008491 [Trapelia coarctata]|nr:hypothetical protein [Trapelia coarctata]